MEQQFRYFIKEGNTYHLKRQYGFSGIIIIGLAVVAIIGFIAHLPALGWIAGILSLLCLVSVMNEKVVIDMNSRQMLIKKGLVKPAAAIPLDSDLSFEISRLIYIFIPINTALNLWYRSGGKENAVMISQGFSKKSMQELLNEIEAITG
ncbi:hypothetical protein [uncultured Chryseobacterium sp.]|uniref:hypothetical protein n=1 Tax=uncultured Chryseobacterium sp. TaxID=259322 RepID=UPI0025F1FA56|nr:hypothetical protein [uncultured Chryseobacterium sp.]